MSSPTPLLDLHQQVTQAPRGGEDLKGRGANSAPNCNREEQI